MTVALLITSAATTATQMQPVVKSGGLLRGLLWVGALLTATVLSKLSVPPLGDQGMSIVVPVLLLLTGIGVIGGAFELEPRRFILAGITLSILGLMQLFKNDVFSPNSLMMLFALYLPFIFQFREPVDSRRVVNFFTLGCGFLALLGIVQFLLQDKLPMEWMFPIDKLVPDAYRVQHFNQVAVLEPGSEVLRANGVFMVEPSYLSQLLAVGVVLELATRHRLWLISLMGIGMLVSYSGTGFIVLALALPVLIISQRRWSLLLSALIGGVLLYLIVQNFGEQLYLDKFLSRTAEFNATGSSGFARFVSGFYLFDQVLWSNPLHTLFGTGSGSFKYFATSAHYLVAEMPLWKAVLEYGVVGAFVYFYFLISCLSTRGLPVAAVVAIGLTFMLNGPYVTFSQAISLSLLMWTRPAESPHLQASTSSTTSTTPLRPQSTGLRARRFRTRAAGA